MSEHESRQVEVWLTLNEERTGVLARIYFEDETVRGIPVSARSISGAEREMTAWLISQGYEGISYWNAELGEEDFALESSRTFRAAGPDARPLKVA